MESLKPQVIIYTDGAAEPNPGRGGYGIVLICGSHRKELSAGYQLTTNNRMELLAVIVGLEALTKPCLVTIYSDSRYVVDSVEKGSLFRWSNKNWQLKPGQKVKNIDLWQRFLLVYEKHQVTFQWVKGHCGIVENERCDELATIAAASSNLLNDEGFDGQPFTPRPANYTAGNSSIKHKEPGEACRKCGTILVKKIPKQKKSKPKQEYYYDWYLFCPGCKAMYMVESAKRFFNNETFL